jgi:hypothetical protein
MKITILHFINGARKTLNNIAYQTRFVRVSENILLPTILFSLIIFVSVPTVNGVDNSVLYSKDSSPFGISYGDWIATWWQWNIGIPPSQHPRDHFSPQTCTTNQTGPVWLLPDILSGKEDRNCTIPHGKAILVPLLTGFCDDDNTDPNVKTDEGLRKCAMAGNEYGLISAKLDGVDLQNLDQYRTQTGFFNLTVPQDNFCNCVPGMFKSMADGFFVFLKPLPVGNHNFTLTTSVSNPVSPSFNYAAESNYHLNVSP